ncbi:two-partner secretion domain-containing protein [Trichothermofontia sp.]
MFWTLRPATLAILTIPCLWCLLGGPSSAQLIPDATLGPESSVVRPDVIKGIPSDRIEGGASRGSNLFHSFQEFNVGANRGVYFANPDGIANILSRVTGANRSNILGTLGVLGNANLFLINPNGIVFGPNARLDLAGSFVGSTAHSVVFDNFEFSASNPQAPPLLEINIPIGLRFRDNPAPIQVQSQDPGLAVQPGQTLALVGGDLTFDRGKLLAPDAQIELASVAGNEQMGLRFTEDTLTLAPETVQQFQDMQLLRGAVIEISEGGSLNLYSRNLTLLGDSQIDANTLGDEPGGSLTLQMTERLTMVGGNIAAQVEADATGEGGDITIAAQELHLSDGAQINVDTFGAGEAGSLIVTADRITAIGEDADGFPSGLFASVQPGATGQGGSLDITTGDLTLLDGAQIFADTFGNGDAGSLAILATRSVTLDGVATDGSTSALSASVNAEATGSGGDLILTTPQLNLRNGGLMSVGTFGQGESGNLQVIADTIAITGTTPGGTASGLYAQVDPGAVGNGGNLEITTQRLQLSQGGQISVSTFGAGDGGNLTIQAQDIDIQDNPSGLYAQVNAEAQGQAGLLTITTDRLRLTNGATIAANTAGQGDAGSMDITATDSIRISGNGSFLGAQVNTGATGRGGDAILTTQRLFLEDGGRISVDTFGLGDAGNLVINASDRVLVDGIGTFITADVNAEATGTGGNLAIVTNRLEITGGGVVGASTFGQGDAGSVLIQAADAVVVRDRIVDGENLNFSLLRAQVDDEATGAGGSLQIETGRLLVADGAEVTAGTFGRGDAGILTVIATDTVEITGDTSFLGAQVNTNATGSGGDTLIQTPRLFVRDGGRISADTFGFGDAGNLTIVSDYLEVAGADTFVTADVSAEATGTGGNLVLQTGRLEVRDGARIGASTFGQGDAGLVLIEASEAIVLQGQVPDGVSSRITAEVREQATGTGGDLLIRTPNLELRDGAQISAGTFGAGDAGNLIVEAGEIDLQGTSADFRTSSGLYAQIEGEATGAGGNLLIEADRLRARDGGQVSVATFGAGDAGNLVIMADRIELEGETGDGNTPSGLFATVEAGAIGNGGNLAIETRLLSITEGARISVSTVGAGNAGSLTIEATEAMRVTGEAPDGTSSLVTAQVDTGATGEGGDLTIVTPLLQVRDGAQISASTKGEGNAGNLLVAADTVELTGTNTTGTIPSALYARVESGATGEGGNLAVVGDRLRLTGGAQIGVDTFGEGSGGNLAVVAEQTIDLADGSLITASVQEEALGDAGNLSVETNRLTLNSGGQILAVTFGFGDAGNVDVEAKDSIRIAGASPDGFPSGLFATVESTGFGTAGSLTARTGTLQVENGAQISVSDNSGFSSAGDLQITADSIRLNRDASLRAETSAGDQGNITLQAKDIQLRRNSNITTNAIGTATGGNIAIDTGVLAALENSDITANAQESFGGRVIINAQGIFGTEFRLQATPESDITATSELGPAFSGIVEIQTPDIDPSQGLVELPENVVDPAALIAANACVQGQQSEFVITGRGGLPPTPQEPLAQGVAPTGWIEPVAPQVGSREAQVAPRHPGTKAPRAERPPIVPAQGWVVTERGEILLTASRGDINIPDLVAAPQAHRAAPQTAACPPSR